MVVRSFAPVLALVTWALVASACNTVMTETGEPSSDPNPNGAPPGSVCSAPVDCRTGVCVDGICQAATNSDGVRNGDETDVDCGGPVGPACGAGKGCRGGSDCVGGNCVEGVCAGGTNGRCGGADPAKPRCADGEGCAADGDCASNYCENGQCRAGSSRCGGADPARPRCAVNEPCNAGTDCESKICDPATKKCSAPTATDNVQNGHETDVDCGGAGNPPCAVGKGCVEHTDCSSNGCAYDKKCASAASCTQLEGGYTCGPDDGMGRQQDCCASAKVGTYDIDKYLVTAGRMRAFVERLNGNVRGWAATLPAAAWNQAYTAQLPQNIDEANKQLGPFYGKRSCDTGNQTQPPFNRNGHVYWTPLSTGDTKDFPKEVLDTKALNCVPWWLMMALCAYDGKHVVTLAELRAAYTNNAAIDPHTRSVYPWGPVGGYTTGGQNDYAIQQFGYATPSPPVTARRDTDGDYIDSAYFIAPPGRRPLGYNATGHADLVGDLLEWVSDRERQLVWKGSWERHSSEGDNHNSASNQPWSDRENGQVWRWGFNVGTGFPSDTSDGVSSMGYYGIGGRCAK